MEQRELDLPGWDQWVRRRPWVADGLLAVALALVLGPTSVSLLQAAPWPAPARIAGLLVLGLAHLSVAVRRIRPVTAYVACCLAMAAALSAGDLPGDGASEFAGTLVPPILLPSALVYPVVLFAAAAYAPRPWPLLALVAGLGGAVLTTARLVLDDGWLGELPAPGGAAWPLFVLGALLAAVVAPWGLGCYRSVRAAYVQALEEREARAEQDRAERAERAVQAERARIAREMHDVVAHSLAVMVRQAEGGRFVAVRDPGAAAAALATVADTGREALADMRAALGLLRRPGEAADGGPQPTVQDVGELVDRVRGTGLDVTLRSTGRPQPLDRAASLAAYRVVQEGLTNVVKHVGTDARVDVVLTWHDGGLDVTVTDDGGHGQAPAGPASTGPGGHGLTGMRERVTLAGGDLVVGPDPASGGFTIRAFLPARAADGAS